jgi:hypothetical protein
MSTGKQVAPPPIIDPNYNTLPQVGQLVFGDNPPVTVKKA